MVTHHILDASLLVHHGSEHQLPAQVWLSHHCRAAAAQTYFAFSPSNMHSQCITDADCECSMQMAVRPQCYLNLACLTHALLLHVQLEVIFAALWSIASWRGVYAGLRPYI